MIMKSILPLLSKSRASQINIVRLITYMQNKLFYSKKNIDSYLKRSTKQQIRLNWMQEQTIILT